MKKINHMIMERDYRLLRFLWKWKAVSTRALAKKFSPNIQPRSAYRRLEFLEDGGYIGTFEVDSPRHRVWELRDKGFKHILPKLGELESIGYKSENRYHDFLTTAFHLGEWLTGQPENTQNFSEQQLRRFHPDTWPEWIPRSTLHRPDGYSVYVQRGQKVVVAFETELSIKARDRYLSVATFYDAQPSIQLVFWLIDSKNTLTAIRSGFEKAQVREWPKHHFVLLKDFLEKGWTASFIEGKFKGHNPSQFLNRVAIESSSKWHRDLDAIALLDSRRRPINPNPSPNPPTGQKSD